MPNHDINLQEELPNDPGISSDINQAVIDQTNLTGYQEDPYSRQLIDNFNSQFTPQAIGPQGASLYPGLKHNINVGSQSGQIIGGQNIYVPGGNIAAIDPILARRKAIDDAARQRAGALKPFDPGKPGVLKDARFQKKFNETWNTQANVLMDEAKEKYGKDFSIVLQDPSSKEGREFVQSMANFEVMQRKFDQFVDLTAEMREGLLDKSKVYSPEVIKKLDDFEGMMGDFEGGDIWKSQDIDKMYKEFEGHRSFEDYIQTGNFLSDISGITSGWGNISDDGAYFTTSSGESIKFESAVNEVVESLMADSWGNDVRQGYYDKAQMTKTIRARLKDTSKFKKTAQIKKAESVSGASVAEEGIRHGSDKPGLINMLDYDDSGDIVPGTGSNFNAHYEHDINTADIGHKKSLRLDNIRVVNEGRIQTLEGNSEMKLTGIKTVDYVDRHGNKQTRVVGSGKINSPVKKAYKKDKVTGKQVQVPWSEYESAPDKDSYRVREEEQIIDKLFILDEHAQNQIRNQLEENLVDGFNNAVNMGVRVKKEVSGAKPKPKGTDFN